MNLQPALEQAIPVAVPYPRSPAVTHQHIFSVVCTLLAEGRLCIEGDTLRILDIGCGDGRLIAALHFMLTRRFPHLNVEIHGFDVAEHGFRDSSQLAEALSYLTGYAPSVEWEKRIKLISDDERWGYPPAYFHLAVSNQVLEHVQDIDHFMANLRDVLAPGGQSVHVFPLSHCMQEAHCGVPFSHWIKDFNYRVAWIKLVSRFGIGRYLKDRRVLGHTGLAHHSLETAKFIECWTFYRSFSEISKRASEKSLATSYHFTKNIISAKLRHIAKREAAARYRRWIFLGLEWLAYIFVRSITSATIVIEPVAYDIGKRIAAEKSYKYRRVGG